MEVMAMTSTVKDYIKKDNIEGIYQLLGSNQGDMLSMNESLFRLVQDGKLTQEEALNHSNSPDELGRTFRCNMYSKKAADNIAKEEAMSAKNNEEAVSEQSGSKTIQTSQKPDNSLYREIEKKIDDKNNTAAVSKAIA